MISISSKDKSKINAIVNERYQEVSINEFLPNIGRTLVDTKVMSYHGYFNHLIDIAIYYGLYEENLSYYRQLLVVANRTEYLENYQSLNEGKSQNNGKRHFLGLLRAIVLEDKKTIEDYFNSFPEPSNFKVKGWNSDINFLYYMNQINIDEVTIRKQLKKAISLKSQSNYFKSYCEIALAILDNDKEQFIIKVNVFSKLHMKQYDNKNGRNLLKYLNWELMMFMKYGISRFGKDIVDYCDISYVDFAIINNEICESEVEDERLVSILSNIERILVKE